MPVDILTILYVCILIFVGITSFYLGRASVGSNMLNNQPKTQINTHENMPDDISKKEGVQDNVGGYFGSINGKLYYSRGCKAGNRIAKKNIINFSSVLEAEKAGYKPSSSCK